MKAPLKIIAYFCIATTPLQILIVLWGIHVVLTSDLGFLFPIVEWFYSWFWNAWLDFIFSLPLIIAQTFKAIASTWLGFWILKKLK